MKKILTFIPLGIGISAAFLYLYNIVYFKVINNAATLSIILSNIKVYLYISVAAFIVYFLIKLLDILSTRNKILLAKQQSKEDVNITYSDEIDTEYNYDDEISPISLSELDNSEINDEIIESQLKLLSNNTVKQEPKVNQKQEYIPVEKIVVKNSLYCNKCDSLIEETDLYCKYCGSLLKKDKHIFLKKVINVIEIVILLLVIYFSLVMLFDYKESTDPNFTSPFKVTMTK